MINKSDVLRLALDFAQDWEIQGFLPTRLACRRFINIFEDIDIEQRAFIQTRWKWQMQLPLPKGKADCRVPLGWQAMCHCYRWGLEAGVEGCGKITLVFITRKSGKTSFSAELALSTLEHSRNAAPSIYSLATKEAQAKLTWTDGWSIVRRMARAKGETKQWGNFKAMSEVITNEANDGKWEILPSDPKTLDGLQFELAIIDEAGQVPDELYNVIQSAMSDTVYGQHLLAISTAGASASNWFARMVYESVDRLEAGEDIDVNLLCWCVPEDRPGTGDREIEYNSNDDVGKEKVWIKTHPTLGVTITLEEIARQYRLARSSQSVMSEFRRTRLNEFTMKDVNSLCSTATQLAICNKKHDDIVEEVLKSGPCYIGVDITTKLDPASVAITRVVDDIVYTRTKNWIANESFQGKVARKRTLCLRDFIAGGYLEVAGGDYLDYQFMAAYIGNLIQNYKVMAIYSDTVTAGMDFRYFVRDDFGVPVFNFGKNAKEKFETINYFVDRLLPHQIKVSENPMFRWELDNAALMELPNGKKDIVKLDDDKSTPMTIDGVYAVIHSLYPYYLEKRDSLAPVDFPQTVEEFEKVKGSYFA